MRRWLLLLALASLVCGLFSCASEDPMNAGRTQESTIPWNRPQSWEGPGVYGSALNQR